MEIFHIFPKNRVNDISIVTFSSLCSTMAHAAYLYATFGPALWGNLSEEEKKKTQLDESINELKIKQSLCSVFFFALRLPHAIETVIKLFLVGLVNHINDHPLIAFCKLIMFVV